MNRDYSFVSPIFGPIKFKTWSGHLSYLAMQILIKKFTGKYVLYILYILVQYIPLDTVHILTDLLC